MRIIRNNNRFNKGFTLIELLIVLAITAVIATVATTSLFGIKADHDLENDAKKISATLRDAQTRSITAENIDPGEVWGVHLENPLGVTNGYFELFRGISYSQSPTILYRKLLYSSIEFQKPIDGASENILFSQRSGTTTATTIEIRQKNSPTRMKTITVTANGTLDITP